LNVEVGYRLNKPLAAVFRAPLQRANVGIQIVLGALTARFIWWTSYSLFNMIAPSSVAIRKVAKFIRHNPGRTTAFDAFFSDGSQDVFAAVHRSNGAAIPGAWDT